MRENTRAIILAAILVVSVLAAAVPSGAAAATSNSPPGGMVGVPDSNIEDIRPSGLPRSVSETDVEGSVYVSEHAATTEVSIVTEKQADAVARGASPSAVAGDAVCGATAGANPTYDCGTSFTLVISDDVHHEGRRVAIRASVLRESMGYVPAFLTIRNNQSGERYRAPATVEDGWLVAYTEGYSSNSVTWSGEVNISASPASDGSQWQYDTKDIDSVSDPVVNLTGVTNTEWDNVSASGVADGGTVSLDVAGNTQPTGPSANGEPTVTFAPGPNSVVVTKVVHDIVSDNGDGTAGDSEEFVGDNGVDEAFKTSFEFTASSDGTLKGLQVYVAYANGNSPGSVDVYIDASSGDTSSYTEGTKIATWNPEYSTGKQIIDTSSYSVTAGTTYEVQFVSTTDNDGSTEYLNIETDTSPSTNKSFLTKGTSSSSANEYGHIELIRFKKDAVEDPGIDIDGDGSVDAQYSGVLETSATYELPNMTVSDDVGTISTTQGETNVTVKLKERTKTADPGVEINGHWLNHTGTLSDGETVSLTGNSSWLVEGTNRVNLSVGDGTLSADAPNPQVGLTYSHDAKSKVSVDYTAEKWTERYDVSRTWAGDRQTANLTIPFEGTVVAVRDITVYSNGTKVSPQSTSFDGTTLTVELGSVDLNETTRVVTNASKVQVSNGAITVLEPTKPGDRLDSKIRVTSANSTEDLIISVGGTDGGRLIHYSYNESWSGADEYAMFTGKSAQDLVLPDAAGGSEFRVSTIPVRIGLSSSSADVAVEVSDPRVTEPKFSVTPGASSGDSVSFTFVSAQDDTEYSLYSLSRDVVLDSGTANSPLTLEDDDSDEIIEFRLEDDGISDDDDDGGGGTKNPEEVTVKAGGAAVTVETTAFIGALAALMVGIWFVTNNFGDSGGISDKTLFYGIGVLAVTMGIETLSPAGLVGTVFGTLSTFIGRGLARAMPLVILVLGYLGYRYFKTRGTPQKVVNFQLGGGKGGT